VWQFHVSHWHELICGFGVVIEVLRGLSGALKF
jgi:hypothetical protein